MNKRATRARLSLEEPRRVLSPSGCLNLNWIRIQLVNSPKAPKNTIRMIPGIRPTTASEDGKESMPLLTISAIISTATSSHDRVL